mmetsp:Transcript_27510/g.74060  ORF Transcript_27510/g.74060 Transcript_27510/m.74060 type:complete len:184 (+) Transcript_27510:53-604(+)|eukprot:CAMPEP_0185184156 /NCGR_PEP_ID=MMETSP1140-20130426/2413_1 /TAXON_ID=298111 /ORGANISM="Pavlova sp., Strain CCMP459" /LENGTH=183 /DNA_ID=CAMNT_0027750211 /DNA_START=26 /DNA_END=577 /DNA_ORIENTATION=+
MADDGSLLFVPPAVGVRVPGDALEKGIVAVRHTGTIKGFGVFASTHMGKGTWVGDYVGVVLTQQEFLEAYPRAEDAQYVLGVNDNYNIDAVDPARSSFCRFINHALWGTPGCNVYIDVVKRKRQRTKDVHLYTSRAVQPGEELCFDYGPQYAWKGPLISNDEAGVYGPGNIPETKAEGLGSET